MQRGSNNTVTDTGIVILIRATSGESEGCITFAKEIHGTPVRAFRESDLKRVWKALRADEAKHLSAVMMLKEALSGSDPLALKKAERLFEEHYALRKKLTDPDTRLVQPGTVTKETAHVLAQRLKHPSENTDEISDILNDFGPWPPSSKSLPLRLSHEISRFLDDARLVLWCDSKGLRPAIWCDDLKTAYYARVLLGVVAGKGLRMCPFCGEPFVQERSDQSYCCVAHREAHRVARWRARKKAKHGKKRRHHGPNKTR